MDGSTAAVTSVQANSAGDANASQPHLGAASTGRRRGKQQYCRYFGTQLGCRAGDSCAFAHDASNLRDIKDINSGGAKSPSSADRAGVSHSPKADPNPSQPKSSHAPSKPSADHRGLVGRSRVVQRPVPQAQTDDPREFQLQQIRRRFSPQEQCEGGISKIKFDIKPSDPDFPFEIDTLKCILTVPLSWPAEGSPKLKVNNSDIPRGYQINIEKGFDALIHESKNATLLGTINALDKRLESLLVVEKAKTIKVVSNQGHVGRIQEHNVPRPQSQVGSQFVTSKGAAGVKISFGAFTADQKRQAQANREIETRQLEARLRRSALFSKSSDGVIYTIPLDPRQRSELPDLLQSVKSVELSVPPLYNLQPCSVQLLGVTRDAAKYVEQAFAKRAEERLGSNLMEHVNYLAQNMRSMAIRSTPEVLDENCEASEQQDDSAKTEVGNLTERSNINYDRDHIQIIPRPPEWTLGASSGEDSDSYNSSTYDSGDESSDDDTGVAIQPASEARNPEKGILLSFPFLELYGIELLELVSLSVTLKCLRCKDTMDVNDLRDNAQTTPSLLRNESCKKCASIISSVAHCCHNIMSQKYIYTDTEDLPAWAVKAVIDLR